MDVELKQMKLRLSSDRKILAALKHRKRMQPEGDGEKLVLQFDGKDFDFRPGVTLIVGETVGHCLVRESLVIAGDNDLTDPMLPAVESLGSFVVGEVVKEEKKPNAYCNACEKDFYHYPRLMDHIAKEHIQGPMKPPTPSTGVASQGIDELSK